MASKAKTRVKFSNNGRNVVANFPIERLRTILPTLPPGEERQLLEAALLEADEAKALQAREARLAAPLSIESLIPLGWMLTGSHSSLAYGAVRQGDFRQEDDGRWAYGPTGAFDREEEGTVVMRDAIQAGVMSEEHFVYRLLEPTTDSHTAIADAMGLEREWLRDLPRKCRKPRAMLEGGVFGHEAKGMSRLDWLRYMDKKDLEGLPEGARFSGGRQHYRPSDYFWRPTDVVHHSERNLTTSVFRCHAALRPVMVCMGSSIQLQNRTAEYRWTVVREYDPSYDGMRPRALTTPYDCVLGKVWAATHNGQLPWTQTAGMAQINTGGGGESTDRRDNQAFPLATKEEADIAANSFAVTLGIIEGEAGPLPETIPAPEMDGGGVDLAQAA